MAIKNLDRKLNEEELYAPDLDEGERDVEAYPVPDGSAIDDPYLRAVWEEARRHLEADALEKAREAISAEQDADEEPDEPDYPDEPESYARDGWVTVGGTPNPDEGTKHEGGTPVYVEGGHVTKGPDALKGKKLGGKGEGKGGGGGLKPVKGRIEWDGTLVEDPEGTKTIYKDDDGKLHRSKAAHQRAGEAAKEPLPVAQPIPAGQEQTAPKTLSERWAESAAEWERVRRAGVDRKHQARANQLAKAHGLTDEQAKAAMSAAIMEFSKDKSGRQLEEFEEEHAAKAADKPASPAPATPAAQRLDLRTETEKAQAEALSQHIEDDKRRQQEKYRRSKAQKQNKPAEDEVELKETHQMTLAEYRAEYQGNYGDMTDDVHRGLVQKALVAGKPVPPEVLADYPDMKPPG